jgi:hypothetical protein
MTDQLAIVPQKHQIISNFDDLARAATAMSKSGYFQDSRDQAQAIVKIMAGQEMGFGAFASMTGIYIIQGKPTIGANLMASAVKGSGKYDYRIITLNDTIAEIEFFQQGKSLGTSKFTMEDAKKACITGKDNWQKFARNMLFSRAMSNGVRWYCPDVFNGSAVYTPEELGAEVNADGDVINSTFVEKPADPEPIPDEEAQFAPFSIEEAKNFLNSQGVPYGNIDTKTLSNMANALSKKKDATPEDANKITRIQLILKDRSEHPLVDTDKELGGEAK